ncbi:hypothetical protein ACAG39_02095 [Caldicellulosiruptoraceae bacterium PP1]
MANKKGNKDLNENELKEALLPNLETKKINGGDVKVKLDKYNTNLNEAIKILYERDKLSFEEIIKIKDALNKLIDEFNTLGPTIEKLMNSQMMIMEDMEQVFNKIYGRKGKVVNYREIAKRMGFMPKEIEEVEKQNKDKNEEEDKE